MKDAPWRKILKEKVIPAFPAPWADHGADRRFEDFIKRSLHGIDQLKQKKGANKCILGKPEVWIKNEEELHEYRATKSQLPGKGESMDDVVEGLANFFNGMVDWGHPKAAVNVVPPSSIPAITASLFSSIFNPNIIEQEYSVNLSAAEVEAVGMSAVLAGYDPAKAGGVFTFGGLGTWLYAVKVALTNCLGIESRHQGIRQDAQLLVSKVAHFSKINCADWSGLGMDNVRQIGLNEDNSMDMGQLREAMREYLGAGKPVALINCTTGTTDAFGVDDVKEAVAIRDQLAEEYSLDYKPHVHADAVIGWPWMCFRDYDFAGNPLGFSDDLAHELQDGASRFRHLGLADSIGFDFHKTGYTSYVSSLYLAKDGEAQLDLLRRPVEEMAYLFHFGAYNPGEYTLESSRSALGPLAAWANLKYFGVEGYQVLLARLVESQMAVRHLLAAHEDVIVVNPKDHGFVTLLRVYPRGIDAQQAYKKEFEGKNEDGLAAHNRFLYEMANELFRMHREEGGPLLSFTTNHRPNLVGSSIAALKVFPMSPHTNVETLKNDIVPWILKAREIVEAKQK
jgi:glutamate/tyrosine decarboxylase-like PLP-dependent enzyme